MNQKIQAGQTFKRFLVFASDTYEPAGGLDDIALETEDYGEVRRLVRELATRPTDKPDAVFPQGYFHVFDCEERRVLLIGKSWSFLSRARTRFEATRKGSP